MFFANTLGCLPQLSFSRFRIPVLVPFSPHPSMVLETLPILLIPLFPPRTPPPPHFGFSKPLSHVALLVSYISTPPRPDTYWPKSEPSSTCPLLLVISFSENDFVASLLVAANNFLLFLPLFMDPEIFLFSAISTVHHLFHLAQTFIFLQYLLR